MALYNVATHYFSGLGVPQNMEKAKEYYEKAAILGFYPAQVRGHYELHLMCGMEPPTLGPAIFVRFSSLLHSGPIRESILPPVTEMLIPYACLGLEDCYESKSIFEPDTLNNL